MRSRPASTSAIDLLARANVDTGQQSAVFDPFWQADSSDTRHYDGAGLGLHITARLVEVLGGTIEVESEVEQGTEFRVWLPCETEGYASVGTA